MRISLAPDLTGFTLEGVGGAKITGRLCRAEGYQLAFCSADIRG